MFDGKFLFNLKATYGFPLDFALEKILDRMPIDWPGFVDEARRNKRYDYQTLEDITHLMQDADLPKGYQHAVIAGFKNYVVKNDFFKKSECRDSVGDEISQTQPG